MQILDQAVAVMRAGKGTMDGAKAAALLEAIAAAGDEAARVWQGYVEKPGAPGDKYTLISWMGAERANRLQDLSHKAGELVKQLCAGAGAQSRFLVMDESPIQMAYIGLKEGETGPQAAAARLAAQQATNKHLRELASQVKSARAGKGGAAKTAKPAAKKAVSKKPAAKKKAPARKSMAKKPAAKKAKPKKAPKKK
jgi:hypothetical protein